MFLGRVGRMIEKKVVSETYYVINHPLHPDWIGRKEEHLKRQKCKDLEDVKEALQDTARNHVVAILREANRRIARQRRVDNPEWQAAQNIPMYINWDELVKIRDEVNRWEDIKDELNDLS
jgi:hypothetical protein